MTHRSPRVRKPYRPRLEALEDRTLLSATLVKDINTDTSGALEGNTGQTASLDGIVYYVANDGIHGAELWKTDGTAAGTALVKDINPGPDTAFLDGTTFATLSGSLLFRTRIGGAQQLWRTDGTEAGTVPITPASNLLEELVVAGDYLYYTSNAGGVGTELFRTDGTAAGTALVKDLNPGSAGSSPVPAGTAGDILYFVASTPGIGRELWKTDGTEAGTVLVKDMVPGQNDSGPDRGGVSLNGELIFTRRTGPASSELWKTDGTGAGTVKLASLTVQPPPLTHFNGRVYFAGNGGSGGTELWSTDGTAAGTGQSADINPGAGSSDPRDLTAVGGRLFFSAALPSTGRELWVSDGTAAGTALAKDIAPGTGSSLPERLAAFGGKLFFAANAGTATGIELWMSDGTAAGTVQLKDINAGPQSSAPGSFVVTPDALFFAATSRQFGRELWKTDGTAGGTGLVADVDTRSLGTLFDKSIAAVDRIYFTASGAAGRELWVSDGTTAGTHVFNGQDPEEAVASGTRLFFTTPASSSQPQLYVSDGTPEGTVLLKEFQASSFGSGISQLTDVNGTVFFVATDTAGAGLRLWKSDGTAEGTVPVKKILATFPEYDEFDDAIANLTAVNGTLFFDSFGDPQGWELYKSDGTAEGTGIVKDIAPGDYIGSFPQDLTGAGSLLFFTVVNDDGTITLWKSDGSEAGTVTVRTFDPGATPTQLTAVGGRLYFTVGPELWTSDGTAEGTAAVGTAYAGFGGSSPTDLTAVGDRLYFLEFTPAFSDGRELWVSDGTAAGTHVVRVIVPGTSQAPANLTAAGGLLAFTANDGIHGAEVWRSDGTAEGTYLVADVRPGTAGSSPSRLRFADGRLFFTADDGTHGMELWAVSPPQATLDGPPVGVSYETLTFTLGADGSSGPVTYTVDWGDGQTELFTGPSGTAATHEFAAVGDYTVTLSLSDDSLAFSASTPVTLTVQIGSVRMRGDGLAVGGAAGDDDFVLTPGAEPGTVSVTLNDQDLGTFTASGGQVIVYGGPGSDGVEMVAASGGSTLTAGASGLGVDGLSVSMSSVERTALTGGAGDDTFVFEDGASVTGLVTGGGGADRLDYSAYTTGVSVNLLLGSATGTGGVQGIRDVTGGAGDDLLVGDDQGNRLEGLGGWDLLIGRGGADTLLGGDGDDLLIAGGTAHDGDTAALDALMAAWTRRDQAYLDRIASLRAGVAGPGGAGVALNAHSTADDGARDVLTGGAGLDWFLARRGHFGDDLTDILDTEAFNRV